MNNKRNQTPLNNNDIYDVVVIGGGFYGCHLAQFLGQTYSKLLLIESESELMQRASYVNQARIHNGYHYPRSLLTALRSRVNFPKFVDEYGDCVVSDFQKVYAIAKHGSKVNAKAFEQFCERIRAPIEEAPPQIQSLFSSSFIEKAFLVKEYAFDSAVLKDRVFEKMHDSNVEVVLNSKVNAVRELKESGGYLAVHYNNQHESHTVQSRVVINCTYSQINSILFQSNQNLVPLKHELTEMPLIEMPPALRDIGITVMDGAFFSIMPFPSKNLHSMSHVRYTPHMYWHDESLDSFKFSEDLFQDYPRKSRFNLMIKDIQRYIPAISECRYHESIWEVKTILPQSEQDDSRPILCSIDPNLDHLYNIMGGKIDNIYDIEEFLKKKLLRVEGVA